MFEHGWPVYGGTLVSQLWPDAEVFSWWMRLVQGAVAAGACAGVVLALRRRRGLDVVWLAPFTATLGRVALDPTNFSYYWTPAAIAALAGLSCVEPRTERARFLLLGGLAYLPYLRWGASALPVLAVSVVLLVAATLEARRRQTSTPDHASGSPSVVADVPRRTVSVPAGHRTTNWSPDALS
jgi:hypothetical protein